MPQPRDYYDVLAVSRGADEDEIRRAYRSLARQYHPDVNKEPEARQRFEELTEAYEVLSDPEKRKAYDRFGRAGAGVGAGRGPGGGPAVDWSSMEGFGGVDAADFNDLFAQMFSGAGPGVGRPGAAGPAAPRGHRGQDLEHQVTVTFMTAVKGGTEDVRVTGPDGAPQRLTVKIPPGIEPGAKLRVRGKGGVGVGGGASGDLIVEVLVGEHPLFTRDGLDVSIEVPINIAEAALGTTATVPLMQGEVKIHVPAGASSGRKLRVPGQGVTDASGQAGDFYAVIRVVAPESLSDRAHELLEELRPELRDPREDGSWAE